MDNVQHPRITRAKGSECIDVIEATLGPYGFRMFCLGNVLEVFMAASAEEWRRGFGEEADVYRAWMLAGTAANRANTAGYCQAAGRRHRACRRLPGNGAPSRDLSPAVQELIERSDEDAPTAHLKAGEAVQ